MAIHNASGTPSLDGQVANAPGLTSTASTGLAIPQDAGTASSSIISSLIGDKYVLRNIFSDLRDTKGYLKV